MPLKSFLLGNGEHILEQTAGNNLRASADERV